MQVQGFKSTQEINNKLTQIKQDLTEGKWVTDQLTTKNKNWRITRILKRVISVLFGDMFSHIRTDRVALAVFSTLQKNSKHADATTQNLAIEILDLLEGKTTHKNGSSKYQGWIALAKIGVAHLKDPSNPKAKPAKSSGSLADALKNGKDKLGKGKSTVPPAPGFVPPAPGFIPPAPGFNPSSVNNQPAPTATPKPAPRKKGQLVTSPSGQQIWMSAAELEKQAQKGQNLAGDLATKKIGQNSLRKTDKSHLNGK